MRLILCLLLITLAVPCYGATGGKVCKAVLRESLTFLLKHRDVLEKQLNEYSAPPEAVEAKLMVKDCVDEEMTKAEKGAVALALAQILVECGGRGLLEKYFPELPLEKLIFPA
ncbi:prostatic steroid-binding protein C1-like [Apodemus sylvaticus]|uniref:prostatic steroid-binding protein C1-like n=1 Tax=Apodemus sylvaticus TaxID=10129 RepID=UPI0022421C61|nr:prostatic steroid-binding protein C1-like [Apodemus sylvaticus]